MMRRWRRYDGDPVKRGTWGRADEEHPLSEFFVVPFGQRVCAAWLEAAGAEDQQDVCFVQGVPVAREDQRKTCFKDVQDATCRFMPVDNDKGIQYAIPSCGQSSYSYTSIPSGVDLSLCFLAESSNPMTSEGRVSPLAAMARASASISGQTEYFPAWRR